MKLFHRVAVHVPGLGGPEQFNALTFEEVAGLLGMIVDDLRRQAKALKL